MGWHVPGGDIKALAKELDAVWPSLADKLRRVRDELKSNPDDVPCPSRQAKPGRRHKRTRLLSIVKEA